MDFGEAIKQLKAGRTKKCCAVACITDGYACRGLGCN